MFRRILEYDHPEPKWVPMVRIALLCILWVWMVAPPEFFKWFGW